MLNVLIYLGQAVLFLLLFFLPGYLFLRAYTSWEGPKLAACSFGFSFIFLSSLAFLGFLLPVSLIKFHPLILILVLVFLFLMVVKSKKTLWPLPGMANNLVWIFLAFYGISFAYQVLTPLFTGAGWYGDWWENFEIVQFYLGNRSPSIVFFEHDTLASRPPAYHLLLTFSQIFGGQGFSSFMLFGVLPGIAFFWPAYLLAQKILKGKALSIFPYLLIFSPFLAQSALYPWSKMLSAFYILLAFNFYWDFWSGESTAPEKTKKDLAWAGFWSAWAYLAHPTALFYIVGMGIFAWWRKTAKSQEAIGNRGKSTNKGSYLLAIGHWLLPALLVLLPWHIWVIYQYGPAALITSNPSWAHQSAAGWGEFLGIRVVNFAGNLFPLWFFQFLGGMFFSPESLSYRLYLLYSGFLRYYYNVLPGAITTTVSLLILYYILRKESRGTPVCAPSINGQTHRSAPIIPFGGLIQKYRSLKTDPQPLGFFLFILALCGFGGIVLAQPYKQAEGLVAQGMAPVIIILLFLGAYILGSMDSQLTLVFSGAIILEFLLVRGSHLFFLNQGFLGKTGDRNLDLKESFSLVFPADGLAKTSWFLVITLLALAGIMAVLFIVTSKEKEH